VDNDVKVKIRNAFLHGVRYGARIARKRTQCDVEEIVDELHADLGVESDDVRISRYQNLIVHNPEEP
jgi:hypothetical protein